MMLIVMVVYGLGFLFSILIWFALREKVAFERLEHRLVILPNQETFNVIIVICLVDLLEFIARIEMNQNEQWHCFANH